MFNSGSTRPPVSRGKDEYEGDMKYENYSGREP